jgi:glutamine synthetase
MRWGRDNRTCAFRLVGHGRSLRLENRIPGGDVNPYLATAAVVAAGLAGIEEELELEPAFEGNAYGDPEAEHVPASLAEALDLWRGSAFARTTFGDDVVDHYANMAAVELAAFGRSVTDWERIRGFERL